MGRVGVVVSILLEHSKRVQTHPIVTPVGLQGSSFDVTLCMEKQTTQGLAFPTDLIRVVFESYPQRAHFGNKRSRAGLYTCYIQMTQSRYSIILIRDRCYCVPTFHNSHYDPKRPLSVVSIIIET